MIVELTTIVLKIFFYIIVYKAIVVLLVKLCCQIKNLQGGSLLIVFMAVSPRPYQTTASSVNKITH